MKKYFTISSTVDNIGDSLINLNEKYENQWSLSIITAPLHDEKIKSYGINIKNESHVAYVLEYNEELITIE